jgi:phosphogluconate dehydratase
MRILKGALGTGVVKVSAVAPEHHVISAPCKIFDTQEALKDAFDAGELNKDFVAVVRFQGPAANGMPELHKLTPYLGVLQDRGHHVALVTDGRMSGASGKVLSAIHVSPEAKNGGLLAKLRDGDIIEIDATAGRLDVVMDAAELESRPAAEPPRVSGVYGRQLFASMRDIVGVSTTGASVLTGN